MKQITFFQCEVCRTQYKFQQDAKNCEKYHIRPTSGYPLAGEVYRSYNQQGSSPYPIKITVEMQDGTKLEYRR